MSTTYTRQGASLLDKVAGEREIWFRLMTRDVDSHGTIIEPGGVDLSRYLLNPLFLWMHQSGCEDGAVPDPSVVIGQCVAHDQTREYLDLCIKFDTDELASACYEKAKGGYLRGTSIDADVLEKAETVIQGQAVKVLTRTRLNEASLVILPSNPGAVKLTRQSALRALRSMEKKTMNREDLMKALNLSEGGSREDAEKALLKYLVETSDAPDARKAMADALDSAFPEQAPDEAPVVAKREGEGADESKDKDAEIEALRSANEEMGKALERAKRGMVQAKDEAKDAVKREAKIQSDVQRWAAEGRIDKDESESWAAKHRAGKAERVVRMIPAGAFTCGRIADEGAPVSPADVPAKPERVTRSVAKTLVSEASAMDKNGTAHASAPTVGASKSEAKALIEQARARV